MRNFPALLDIGVMGHCLHGISGLCMKSGVQCYQNGLGKKEDNMTVSEFDSIVSQLTGKTYQLALGGRGDVNKHEDFEGIMNVAKTHDICVSYTTSGLDLTEEEADITKKYCSAIAVSEYRSEYTERAINMFVERDMIVNLHYVLGNNTIDEALDRLKNGGFNSGLNAVIFLLHKPVGLGSLDNVLDINDPKVKEFYALVDTLVDKVPFKIGFDTCNSPAIVNMSSNIDMVSMDACEAGRFSGYITSDMKFLPCSFDNQKLRWAVDLKTHTVKEAWDSKTFNDFRHALRNSCEGCKSRDLCMGGCPITREIVLCDRPEKNLVEAIV